MTDGTEETNICPPPPGIQPGKSQLHYYYEQNGGVERGECPIFYLLGGGKVNKSRSGVFTASRTYMDEELWNKILPRQAWDVMTGFTKALAATKLNKRANVLHCDLDCKNRKEAWGSNQFHAIGCLVLHCVRNVFPGKKWKTDLPFMTVCSTPHAEPIPKYACEKCYSAIVPLTTTRTTKWRCVECAHVSDDKTKVFFYNYGCHIHIAQYRTEDGSKLLFEEDEDGVFRGTGPCLLRENMLKFRDVMIHFWVQLSKKKNVGNHIKAAVDMFPALQYLPTVTAQQAADYVDLAILGSDRGEVKPGMNGTPFGVNGTLRIVYCPKISNCPSCVRPGEECIICGGLGRELDNGRMYSTAFGCVLDFDGNRMAAFEDLYKRPTYSSVLALSRVTCMTLPSRVAGDKRTGGDKRVADLWETPGFTILKGFEGPQNTTIWIDPDDVTTNNALVGVVQPTKKMTEKKCRYPKNYLPRTTGERVYMKNATEKTWTTIEALIKNTFDPKFCKNWSVVQIFYYLQEDGKRGAYICSVDGEYSAYCSNARKCRHGNLRNGGTNRQYQRETGIPFCTQESCKTDNSKGVHSRKQKGGASPLYVQLSPNKKGSPTISLNCLSVSGGFRQNKKCSECNPKESKVINVQTTELLWPKRKDSTKQGKNWNVKVSVTPTTKKNAKKHPINGNVACLFGLSRPPKKKK